MASVTRRIKGSVTAGKSRSGPGTGPGVTCGGSDGGAGRCRMRGVKEMKSGRESTAGRRSSMCGAPGGREGSEPRTERSP